MGVRFDAFHNHVYVQFSGEQRDRADDRLHFRGMEHLVGEGVIDFHLLHGKAIEIAETAVPGAKIVERQAQTERVYFGDFLLEHRPYRP